MDSFPRRVATRFLDAAPFQSVEGPMTAYADWLDNNPALSRITTLAPTLNRQLRLKFRSFPAALKFFTLTDQIHHMSLGAPVEDLSQEFRQAAKFLSQGTIRVLGDERGAEIANAITDCAMDNAVNLRRIGAGATGQLFTKVGTSIALVLEKLSRALGLSAGYRMVTVDGTRWPQIRILTKREEELKALQANNPEMYEEITANSEQAAKAIADAHKAITETGLVPTTINVDGAPIPAGEEYVSKEKIVFPPEGGALPEREFRRELQNHKKSEVLLTGEFRMGFETLRPDALKYEGLRKLTDEDLANPAIIPPGQKTEFRALTDDKSFSKKTNTRIYPTMRDVDGNTVIVDGRFKGFHLDDMVNKVGRLVEGAAYDVDASGIPVPFETRDWEGNLTDVSANKEPYVTLDSKGRFLIKVPYMQGGGGKKDPFKIARDKLQQVSSKAPKKNEKGEMTGGRTKGTSITEVADTQKTTYTFEAKDFATVRASVGGMVMSSEAAKKLRDYFAQMGRQEDALKAESLKSYSLDRIGGFKVEMVIDPETGEPYDPPKLTKDLLGKQKEALSWLESKGYSGLAALDTGVGKCVRNDTLIPTNRGTVQIKDINPGLTQPDTQALVEGWSVLVGGESIPVKAFYYAGTKPTLKVRTRNGYEIEGSLIHPVMTRGANGETFTKLPDLNVGDYVCIERRDGDFVTKEPSLRVPTSVNGSKTYNVPNHMTPDLARLLGYIVAEGWVNTDRGFSVSQYGALNPEVNADIVDLAKSQLSYTLDGSDNDKCVSSTFLRTYLEWMGVDYTLSADKCIPPVVMQSTRESVVQFIRAYVDAEGSVDESGLEVSSASERLLRELQVMLLRLGVVSSRNPKKVVGTPHTYWRLSVTGDNLRRYRKAVGMVSSRKQAMLDLLCERDANSNTNVTPHAVGMVEALREEISLRAGGRGKGGGLNKRFGHAFVHTLTHVRQGRRNPTYGFLGKMLSVAETVGARDTDAFRVAEDHLTKNYFYDPIESITSGFTEVMDIMVDDPRHMFVGNGVVNHNTLLTIATMQKMTRDGAAGDGSRFLYVCPKKLKGNLPRELKAWMTEEAAAGLSSRVDVLSYEEFVARRNGGTRVKKVLDPITGKMVTERKPVLDAKGNPTLDANGKPVMKSVTEKIPADETFGMDPPYAAVFFDEAQALVKNENSNVSRAAQMLNHPRKVLLTASPMEDDPDELYVGIAITNNTVVASGGQGKLTQARKDLIAFRKRFCVRVAGRTVGIKSDTEKDPTAHQDFMAWAKDGMYFANKLDVTEENLKLQKPLRQPVSLTMDPAVEAEYKLAAKGVAKVLKALVGVYRDNVKPTPALRQQVEAYQKALSGYMGVLNALSNYPDEVVDPKTGQPKFPGAVSPKVTASTMLVNSKIENGGKRTLLFTDDPKFAEKSAKQISANTPGHRVAVALAGKIMVFEDGEHKNPKENTFTQRVYKDKDGNKVPKDQWATFVLREIIGADPSIKALVLTKTYSLGQNLQMFSTVVHLDRDSFSNEMMKQRTARAWRTGQKEVVEEYTMDAVYDSSDEKSDPTVDEVRKYIQESQENVFNSIVHESRSAIIGQEWREMGDVSAELVNVNRKLFELAMAPYPAALGEHDYEQSVKGE